MSLYCSLDPTCSRCHGLLLILPVSPKKWWWQSVKSLSLSDIVTAYGDAGDRLCVSLWLFIGPSIEEERPSNDRISVTKI